MNRAVLALCALSIIIGLSVFVLFQSTAENNSSTIQTTNSPLLSSPKTEVIVYQNEPLLKGAEAIISGTVENISTNSLLNVQVEIELKQRTNQSTERKFIKIVPDRLGPAEKGKYSLNINSHTYSETKLISVKSEGKTAGLAFQTKPGTKRPKETPPPTKVIVAPKSKAKGEEFINTPDTAITVR